MYTTITTTIYYTILTSTTTIGTTTMLIRTTSPIEDSEAASTLMSMFTPGGTQKTGVRAKNGQFSFPFSSEKQGKFELDTAAEGGFTI